MSNLWKKLTPQQLRFADCIIEGMNPSDAYRAAYPNQSLSANALKVEASRAKNHKKISAYIDECLAERRREVLLTRDMKRQILGGIARDKQAPRNSRILAIKVDNDMTGDSAPVRIEGEITLFGIFQALQPATGLPSGEELAQIKNVTPAKQLPPPTKEEPVAPAQTAMERAG